MSTAFAPNTAGSGPGATQGPAQQQQTPMNDQNGGDLFPFIQRLQPFFPTNGGITPVEELLEQLKQTAPDVFRELDRLIEVARRVSGLSEDVALRWKEKGNHEFASGQLQQAAVSYTNALLCTETDATMAVLLNNRSAVFFQMSCHGDACIDADRALHYNPTYWKALQRRGRSLEELGFSELGAKDVQAAAAESLEGSNSADVMRRVFGEAVCGMAGAALPPRATVLAPVRVERSAAGRGIVSVTRLDCGPVLEETPYALAARAEALLSTCSYCLQYSTCLYHGEAYRAAKVKSRGFFCSEVCAAASWEQYGETESANPFFLCCPNDALLAYRMVRGMRQYPQLAALELPEGIDVLDEVSKDQFGAAHVRALEGSFSKELQPTAVNGGSESLVAVLGLYMGAVTPAEAEALRKAQRQILLNAIDVRCVLRMSSDGGRSRRGEGEGEEESGVGGALTTTNTTVVLGKCLYPVAALFNHSCDPNCYVSFVGNPQGSSARLVVRAIRPIMEGEELTVSYGGIDRFHFHSMRNRLQTLRERYGFICHCSACRNQVDEPVSAEGKEHYIKASDYYQKGRRLIRERNYRTAVTVLLQSYEIVMRYICPPPRPPQVMVPKTHNALALAYFHLRNRAKCVEHLRAELETDIAIHKTDNRVGMINEYTRLAFVAVNVEERQQCATKALELLNRFYAPSTLLRMQAAYIESSYKQTASSEEKPKATATNEAV